MTADARLIADRYRLEQQIGAGAMGVVWRAHDIRLDRIVAIKQLLMQPGLGEAETEAATARAMREGRIAARLQHPHAISVYDVALDGIDAWPSPGRAVPWLVMEYLPSRSLAAVLAERGTVPPREVAKIGRQIAAALAAAHQAGIVHSDVKPGNVLLGVDGIVKITDFGISRASWEAAVTKTGVVAGTPAYFAPEVARGEPRDSAADVFSLGATLYAAVEGEPPFGLDDNTLALLRTVAEGRVRPPQQAGPLSALLMKMLRPDSAQRPSMTDAALTLGAIAQGGSRARAVRRTPVPTSTAVELPAIPAQEARSPRTWPSSASAPLQAAAAHGRMPDARVPDHPGPPDAHVPPDGYLNDDPVRQDDPVQQTPMPDRPHQEAGAPPGWTAAQARAHPGRAVAVLLGAAACMLVALLVVLALNSGQGEVPDTPAAPAPAAPSVAAAPPPRPALPGPAELEQTVRTYYRLLPEATRAAWELLSPAEQADSGGFARYVSFWNQIDDVRIRGPVDVQGDTVLVNLQFDPQDRGRTLERYQFTMGTGPDGRVLIESAESLGTIKADEDRGGRGDQRGGRDDNRRSGSGDDE